MMLRNKPDMLPDFIASNFGTKLRYFLLLFVMLLQTENTAEDTPTFDWIPRSKVSFMCQVPESSDRSWQRPLFLFLGLGSRATYDPNLSFTLARKYLSFELTSRVKARDCVMVACT